MEGKVREQVTEVLDSLPIGETFEWVDKVSVELTGRVLAELMDTPREDRRLLTHWSDINNLDLHVGGEIDTEEKRYAKLRECASYFKVLFEKRKLHPPGPDLISMLAHSPTTANMGPDEFLGIIVLLMVGGNDTTRNSITGSVVALDQFPQQYEKLRSNPALVASMVPEIIRWVTPVPHMRRTVSRDTEFRGHKMHEGDKVVIWYISGNRDEEVIADPYQFKIDRESPRTHLSFGMGIHRCMGNRIAEMQLKILWEELLKRRWIPEIVGPVERRYSNNVRGFQSMPVRIRVESGDRSRT
jgi:cytochrome P450